MAHFLVTGGAGFIGSHLIGALLRDEEARVTCIDNFEDFYPRNIKEANVNLYSNDSRFVFYQVDIGKIDELTSVLSTIKKPDVIIHLAARAGVRPSIAQPLDYYQTNVMGTLHLLEYAKNQRIQNFVFASSSSVYGQNPDVPWKENVTDLQPISPYAASKIAGENLGQVYSHLYDIQFKALRLFTVYGPRQRPDLAIHKFAELMIKSESIPLFGDGTTYRDYTHVSDIVNGFLAAIKYGKKKFDVFNIGSGNPVTLMELVNGLEQAMKVKATIDFLPKQAGDVDRTYADINKAKADLGYSPKMNIEEGLRDFWDWKRT